MTFDEFLIELRHTKHAGRVQFAFDHEKLLETFTSAQLGKVAQLLSQAAAKEIRDKFPLFSELPKAQREEELSMRMTWQDQYRYEVEVEGRDPEEERIEKARQAGDRRGQGA